MATDGPTPPKCDQEVYQQGIGIPKPLFAFHASIVGFPV